MNKITLAAAALVIFSSVSHADTVSGPPDNWSMKGGCFYFTVTGNSTVFIVPRAADIIPTADPDPMEILDDEVIAVLINYQGKTSITFDTVITAICHDGDTHPVAQFMRTTTIPMK